MRTSTVPLVAALALAAAPSLVSSPTARFALLVPFFGVGLFFALRAKRRPDPVTPSLRERPGAQGSRIAAMTETLRNAMRQTEQAILDINERFMNIAGRARTQLTKAAETVRRSNAALEKAPQARAGGCGLRDQDPGIELQEMKEEAAALTRDIHGVIASLQFEDIVRQQIDRVIADLQQLRVEQEDRERRLARSAGPEGAHRRPTTPARGDEGVVP